MLEERNGNVKQQAVISKQYLHPTMYNKKLLKENRVNKNRPYKSFELSTTPINVMEQFNVTETNKVKQTYLKKILAHELGKSKNTMRQDCLKNHTITPEIRLRMVSL